MTFNAPTVNEYHRGILVTNSFNLGQDVPSGTLFHAVHSEGDEPCEKAFWHFELRKVSNIENVRTLALAWRIGQLIGTPDEVAAQVERSRRFSKV
jgi:hypothetical protein